MKAARRNRRAGSATTAVAGLLIAASVVAVAALAWRSASAPQTEVVATFGPSQPLAPPAGASFAVDGFSEDQLSSAWVLTDADLANVALVDGSLVIDVPAGTEHAAWGELDRPRVGLAVDNEDFLIEVMFARLPTDSGQTVGLSFEKSPGEWVTVDIDRGAALSVQAKSTGGGQTTVVGVASLPGTPEIITLRVGRSGATWNIWYRPDNRELIEVAAFERDLAMSTFAIGAGAVADEDGKVPGVVATVLGLANIGSGEVPGGPQVAIEVIGEGSYTLDPPLEQLGFGDTLIVRAQPAAGWEVLGWSGPGTSEGSNRRIKVDGDLALSLEFGAVSTDTVFDIWYGLDQTFGAYGKSQTFANVLGNVRDPDGIESLRYTLNGGPERTLGIGPDQWRLGDAGDFNVDLLWETLDLGENTVEVTATDLLGNVTSVMVTVRRITGDPTLRPITIDWADVENIQDVVQITDGHFEIRDDTLAVVSPDRDRLMLIGNQSWTDYEVAMVVTPRALDTTLFNPNPGPANIFFAGGWQGHVDWRGRQPQIGYWPTGAFALVLWPPLERIQITGNEAAEELVGPTTRLRFGVSYNMKFRVETLTDGVDYRFKMWPQGTPEPAVWDLEMLETTGPRAGSIGIAAHHLDAVFGPITVTPL